MKLLLSTYHVFLKGGHCLKSGHSDPKLPPCSQFISSILFPVPLWYPTRAEVSGLLWQAVKPPKKVLLRFWWTQGSSSGPSNSVFSVKWKGSWDLVVQSLGPLCHLDCLVDLLQSRVNCI